MFRGEAGGGRRLYGRRGRGVSSDFCTPIILEPRYLGSYGENIAYSILTWQRGADADAVFQAVRAIIDVFLGPPFQAGAFFLGEFADDFGGGSEDEGAGRNLGAGRDEGLRADDGLFADNRAIQNDRAHTDEAFIADFAGVDDGAVAHGDPVTKDARKFIGEVQHGVVLHVGVVADDDAVDVAAQHRAVPDAGVGAERDIPYDRGGFGDERALAELRLFAQKRVQLLI